MLEIDIEEAGGIIFNKLIPSSSLNNKDYHASEGISASGLKQAHKDPKLYFSRAKLMRMPSPALELGTALHEALLEPTKFNEGRYDLTNLQHEKLRVMINNARVMFDYIVSKTINEHSLFVQDAGFIRRVRIDAYDKSQGVIYDVKTTQYALKSKFQNEIYEQDYHLQAAFYIDTMAMAGFKVNAFAFLVVPNVSPCEPFAVQVTDRVIEDGRATYTEVLQNIIDYKKESQSVYFHQADMPKWRQEQLGVA